MLVKSYVPERGIKPWLSHGKVRGKHHRQRAKFALKRVEHESQHFQRDTAEENAITVFTEDNRRGALLAIYAEQGLAEGALDFSAVSEDETHCPSGFDAQAAEQRGWDNGIHGPRVNQQPHPRSLLRPSRICNGRSDVSQAHRKLPLGRV